MSKTKEALREEFAQVTKPVIEFLNKNFHPHTAVYIDLTSAELMEGTISVHTEEYLKG